MLLVTNDDGIDALGLGELISGLEGEHSISVIAPAVEQSGVSHALSLRDPIRAEVRADGHVAVWGSPADCVYLGLKHFFRDADVQMVVSGINKGTNLGSDVHYSGTVGAAKEAVLSGLRGLAVSLDQSPSLSEDRTGNWEAAAQVARSLIPRLCRLPPPPVLWNLNVPDLPISRLGGLKICSLGRRYYTGEVREVPEGYKIGGAHLRFCDTPGTDGYWFSRGHPTLTPLGLDWSMDTSALLSREAVELLEASFS